MYILIYWLKDRCWSEVEWSEWNAAEASVHWWGFRDSLRAKIKWAWGCDGEAPTCPRGTVQVFFFLNIYIFWKSGSIILFPPFFKKIYVYNIYPLFARILFSSLPYNTFCTDFTIPIRQLFWSSSPNMCSEFPPQVIPSGPSILIHRIIKKSSLSLYFLFCICTPPFSLGFTFLFFSR